MKELITDNFFTLIFVFAFLLVTGIRFLMWRKNPSPRRDFFNTGSVALSVFVSAFVGGLLVVFLLVFVFTNAETKFANKYEEIKDTSKYAKPRILVSDTAVYENIGKPNYIGQKNISKMLQKNDTIFPMASFQKGGGFSGNSYLLVNHKGKQFWVLKEQTLDYFEYAYQTQALEFSAKDDKENTLFWERATEYCKMYQDYHGKNPKNHTFNDGKNYASNDTLIDISYYNYNGTKWLKVKRKKMQEQYKYTIGAATHKGHEYTIIKDLKSANDYKPDNAVSCAYYIQHGNFYRDK